jgi:hypothetical protein
MTRRMLTIALALAALSPVQADVTLRATAEGKGLGMSGSTANVTYIKGLRMRSESTSGKAGNVTIFDVDAQKMYILNDKKQEAEVWDMAAFAQQIGQSVSSDNVRASMTANGQTKTLNGQAADGYDIEIVVPATIGGPGGLPITMLLKGVSWIAKGVPGAADYAAFYQGAAEKGWIFSDPRAAQGAPGQAKAMAQMYAEFAKIGGLPYQSEMNITADGEGPVAAMMAKVGGVSTTTTIDSVDTAALDDALFQVPEAYTLKERK